MSIGSVVSNTFNIVTSGANEKDKDFLLKSTLRDHYKNLIRYNPDRSCQELLNLPFLKSSQMQYLADFLKEIPFYDCVEMVFKSPYRGIQNLERDMVVHHRLAKLKKQFHFDFKASTLNYCRDKGRVYLSPFTLTSTLPKLFENQFGLDILIESRDFRYLLGEEIDLLIKQNPSKRELKRADVLYSHLCDVKAVMDILLFAPGKKYDDRIQKKTKVRNRTP